MFLFVLSIFLQDLPSSQYYHISKILELIIAIDPSSVLDVGTGFGKYGVLCREYLELWDGRQEYSNFRRRIDGVEAFSQYITPLHNYVYDHLYVEDILKLVDKLDFNYDLVLLIDVLEHFSKNEGKLLLDKLLSKSIGILISTPKDPSHQKNAFGNTYEIHKSRWTKEELSRLIFRNNDEILDIGSKVVNGSDYNRSCLFVRDSVSIIGYIGSRERVRKLKRKQFVRKVNKIPYMRDSLRYFVQMTRRSVNN